MTWHRIRRYTSLFLVCVILALLVFSEWIVSGNAPAWLRMAGVEIQAACRDVGTQWMVVVCLVSYFVAFVFLQRRSKFQVPSSGDEQAQDPRPKTPLLRNPDAWLSALLLLAMARYAFSYDAASGNTQALMLMVGATAGQGVAAWLAWRDRQTEHPATANPSQADKLRGVVMLVLILLLAGAALLKNETGMEFQYRGTPRWSGPWNNPNTYGVMMGVGAILAVGLFVQGSKFRVPSSTSQVPGPESGVHSLAGSNTDGRKLKTDISCGWCVSWLGARRFLLSVFLISAFVLCGFGLIKSYSRGAWLGTAIALALMMFQVVKCQVSGGREIKAESRKQKAENSCLSWLRTNWFLMSVLVVSVFVLCFWNFRHTERLVARRAFSVGNVNDFSWRNRVAAWEGALQMMAEKPWLGFGWGQPERVYDQFYRTPKVSEGAAFQMNDYFTLGTSVGVPALLCFVAYLLLFSRGSRAKGREPIGLQTSDLRLQIRVVPAAGALVLLVGFWFDGGMFNLSTGAVFWVLLGLGRGD